MDTDRVEHDVDYDRNGTECRHPRPYNIQYVGQYQELEKANIIMQSYRPEQVTAFTIYSLLNGLNKIAI